MLTMNDPVLAKQLENFREQQRDAVLAMTLPPQD
jgi:hypothetical protein